jgi:hypothetical protein
MKVLSLWQQKLATLAEVEGWNPQGYHNLGIKTFLKRPTLVQHCARHQPGGHRHR